MQVQPSKNPAQRPLASVRDRTFALVPLAVRNRPNPQVGGILLEAGGPRRGGGGSNMTRLSGFAALFPVVGVLVVLAAAQDSPKTQFTARELFYYATPAATARAKPAAPRPEPKPPAP